MKTIFKKNDYKILVDVDERKACIVKGANSVYVALEELTPLSALAAKHLKMMGCDPSRYLNIGLSNHVIIKEAEEAWQAAVAQSEKKTHLNETSMIPMFWQNLPGLIELRDAEDTYAACQRSASLMLEYRQRGLPPARLMELRQRYPRAAAYITAEAYSFSGNETVSERGRRAMHLLITGALVEDALSLLPDLSPDLSEQDRSPQSTNRW
ncbi:hypothetical protein KI809_13560 [Geobacter pelophilus]|uniref:Uncharacterized protein n=1 Tax=Geoanaerobacter pelophilus TaxID=60036 RepID=A0AAW4L314_9BACT|nr:hypothetical protein [Geoanaerobacter pelophilus]MBT0665328.1 hypothetical protein [Geoanaerobacter pelophilus]